MEKVFSTNFMIDPLKQFLLACSSCILVVVENMYILALNQVSFPVS